jgi:hypothetical protein
MYSDREPFKCHIHLSDNPQKQRYMAFCLKKMRKKRLVCGSRVGKIEGSSGMELPSSLTNRNTVVSFLLSQRPPSGLLQGHLAS